MPKSDLIPAPSARMGKKQTVKMLADRQAAAGRS
jgi:hypothetical protein